MESWGGGRVVGREGLGWCGGLERVADTTERGRGCRLLSFTHTVSAEDVLDGCVSGPSGTFQNYRIYFACNSWASV